MWASLWCICNHGMLSHCQCGHFWQPASICTSYTCMTTCTCMSPPFTIRHRLSPFVTACHHSSSPFTICHRLLPFVPACYQHVDLVAVLLFDNWGVHSQVNTASIHTAQRCCCRLRNSLGLTTVLPQRCYFNKGVTGLGCIAQGSNGGVQILRHVMLLPPTMSTHPHLCESACRWLLTTLGLELMTPTSRCEGLLCSKSPPCHPTKK